jgi:ArsR family transcriptional regulator, arsenate/arsenite/antimonite-responsive transcriptional repressor / arsenate reductase (thioredoxin)
MNDTQANPHSEVPQQEEAPTQETRAKRPNWDFAGKPVRVLFLCTHNQARSQMAEALTHDLSQGQVEALSAGNHPAAQVHPLAVRAIARLGADMSRHVPKSLDQFRGQTFDRIIILCDQNQEDCPTIDTPGVISWNFPDPVLVEGTEQERQRAFNLLATELATRIRLLLTLLEKEKRAGI